ncbi:MFS transporter [Psychroserpens sp.]|uniref:MFS transporter n=1 Tax=Psychroserpens sp. TaxID=2020870 RepID=UPI001B241877|nr:MFS transporter [Psychroserpens sp.]MBO6606614.1 MFS transporter [Psychroserpens sp.]MBO6653318.1 MFS transporter [Psychroserpens sp.]MBO6680655.1 MFS transporter [Psychroserpens sp.]MBO6750387.1 MFS transporter [Psychroserpens sp.]MBO6914869.1 MFS transporter [Psychroserpens sp.]
MSDGTQNKQPLYVIILLILAAEAVFILPFVLQRIFRPTFLETFNINNEQIGYCFSVYGIVALFSYLFGGPIADKFQPKNLMSTALLLTAIGGIYLATYPSLGNLQLLYGYWGFTTIFLFWAAMIKATRLWGGPNKQGIAFGFLDGGRGLVAAAFGSVGVLVFSMFIDVEISEASLEEKSFAFKQVILVCSGIVSIIAILVYFFLKPERSTIKSESAIKYFDYSTIRTLLKMPSIRLLMLIILCAYTGYKATDLFTLYATDVMLYDAIDSAKVGTSLLYIRPLIGVIIGFMADRTKASLWLIIGFALMVIASIVFSLDLITEKTTVLFVINILFMAIGVYSCRVLYFATLEEATIPIQLTGTAVGLASIVGYTPDIFSGPMFGILVDNPDKVAGLQNAFLVLSIFGIIGLIASYRFFRINRHS